jgi:aspartate kinase
VTAVPDVINPVGGQLAATPRARRVVWKFGGTSIGDARRLQLIVAQLVAARRAGTQVVAVLSAMGGATDDLVLRAKQLSTRPHPRELDALLSVGESMSCALAAIAVHDLGAHAVSLTGQQAGVLTDDLHGNARLRQVRPERVAEELEGGAIVLVAGFQGVSKKGDVTTLGRGGSDASAIALASALGLSECDIFTDVPGVFTADPRVVADARMLAEVSQQEMVHLARAGARVLQTRAVELASAYGVDIHVRSSFTFEPGTWIRRRTASSGARVRGIAHIERDPVHLVPSRSPEAVTAALTDRGLSIGTVGDEHGQVRFTACGADVSSVVAAMAALDGDVVTHDELGSVTAVGPPDVDVDDATSVVRSALAANDITAHFLTSTAGRVTCHVSTAQVNRAVQALHDAFQLHAHDGAARARVGAMVPARSDSVV